MDVWTLSTPANVSPEQAMADLVRNYAGYEIVSFRRETNAQQQPVFKALIKKAEVPMGADGPPQDSAVGMPAPEDMGPPPPEEAPEEKPEHHDPIKHLTEQIHELTKLVKKVLGEGGDEDGDVDKAVPNSDPAAGKDLPPPVQEPLPQMPGGSSMLSKRLAGKQHTVAVNEDAGNMTIKEAKAELDKEFNPVGFRVAKIVTRHIDGKRQIIAGLVRVSEDDEKDEKHPGWKKIHDKLTDKEGYSEEEADRIDGAIKKKVDAKK